MDETAPHGYDEIAAFYGWDPKRHPDPTVWEREALAYVNLPAPFLLSWDPHRLATRMGCHRKLVPIYEQAFADIKAAGLWKTIERFGGSYAFRLQRGSDSELSMHAFGAAWDIDPQHNARGTRPEKTTLGGTPEGALVRGIMARHGFTWGGGFRVPDAMHFQYGSGY